MEDGDWDLQAVVRGCCGQTASTTTADPFSSVSTATADPFSSVPPLLLQEEWGEQDDLLFCFPDLFGAQTGFHELEELWKPFFPESPRRQSQQQQQQQQRQQLQFSPQGSSSCSAAPQLPPGGGGTAQLALEALTQQLVQQPPKQRTPPHTPRLKKRKNQLKRVVCQVPADGVSSDVWAWRKYGQKPIKGSPYPRGYYRCSSCKGCLARKQVERSRTDPGMFVITYTGEHSHPPPTHRNSLAGSTRQKFPSSSSPASSPAANSAQEVNAPGGAAATAGGTPEQPDCKASPSSPPSSPSAGGLSPTTPLTDSMEEELHLPRERGRMGEDGDREEEGGLLLVGDMELLGEDDMLFLGVEELREPNAAAAFAFSTDAFSDQFGAFPTPWMANNTAAAAGGS